MNEPLSASPRRPVAATLLDFRRNLVLSCCVVGFWISVLSCGVNLALGALDAMFVMSVLGGAVSGGVWLRLRKQPEALDASATALLCFAGALVAVGWPRFGGILGSSPALLFPIAGLSLVFTTRRRQRIAVASLVAFATLLYAVHLFAPHVIDSYYPDEQTQLWDVAASQWLCVLFVGWLFIRMSSHHLRGWEELAQQRDAHLSLVQREAQRAEEDLLNRLELTRQMGDGLAHDLNNMLFVIRGSAECLEDADEEEKAELRDAIVEGATTAARLVDRYRQSQAEQPERLDLRVLLGSLQRSVVCLAPGVTVAVDVEQGPAARFLFLPRLEFEQVVMNLCLNAVNAMDETGELTLSVRPVGGAALEVAVCDTGCGIPEADLPHIFEPFFTTRRESGGTGVGLANVRQIVDRWEGHIAVESTVGQGTCIRLVIPARTAH